MLPVKGNKSTGERNQRPNEGRGEKNEGERPSEGQRGGRPSQTHLAKRALHAAQKVGLLQPIVGAADVMDFKPQALYLLEVKVHCEQF